MLLTIHSPCLYETCLALVELAADAGGLLGDLLHSVHPLLVADDQLLETGQLAVELLRLHVHVDGVLGLRQQAVDALPALLQPLGDGKHTIVWPARCNMGNQFVKTLFIMGYCF